MNADYKTVLIESLKSFDANSVSDVKTLVALVAEELAKAEIDGNSSPVKENTYLGTLRAIQKEPQRLNLDRIEKEKSSEKISIIIEELLLYFHQYEDGIADMKDIANDIKA